MIQAPAYGYQNNLNYNLGIYAQDRWTVNRMTLSGGIRLDMLNESTSEFTLGPHRWLPNRNTHYDAVKDVPNWKDINPRGSLAYDLFGNGKTALKASASRAVAQNSIAIAAANNPAATVRTQTSRAWNDVTPVPGGIPGDFTPQCNLIDWHRQWRVRTVALPGFREQLPHDSLRPRHHVGLGRAAVQLGIFSWCPA